MSAVARKVHRKTKGQTENYSERIGNHLRLAGYKDAVGRSNIGGAQGSCVIARFINGAVARSSILFCVVESPDFSRGEYQLFCSNFTSGKPTISIVAEAILIFSDF
jgi:hypothetical protein